MYTYYRQASRGGWSTSTMTAVNIIADMIPMGKTVTKALATTAFSMSTITTYYISRVWASDSIANIKRGVKTGRRHSGKVIRISL